MANPLPIHFRKASPFQLSFNWVDMLQGAGYLILYGAGASDSAGVELFLTPNSTIYSGTGSSAATRGEYTDNGGGGTDIDLDFDIEFSIPTVVASADAYIQVPVWVRGSLPSDETMTVTVYHYDGVTETSLGTNTNVKNDPNGDEYFLNTFKIPLTKHSFARGEILRINVTSSITGETYTFHDPSGSSSWADNYGRTINSQMVAHIPFELDI